jgi:glutaredoxin
MKEYEYNVNARKKTLEAIKVQLQEVYKEQGLSEKDAEKTANIDTSVIEGEKIKSPSIILSPKVEGELKKIALQNLVTTENSQNPELQHGIAPAIKTNQISKRNLG